MSKFSEQLIEGGIIDIYYEHPYHQSYHENCSECWKEDRILKAFKVVNDKRVKRKLGL